MKVYDAAHIRNVALVGHQGSGKTMLAEAMLWASGAIARKGSIEEGTTVSDYHNSEKERQMSVFTSLVHAEWKGHKINVLDTPGYPDFVSEVIASLKIADTAIFVINAAEGIQVGTELGWKYAEMTETPAIFVFNHIDHPDVDFDARVEEVKQRFGRGATVCQFPTGPGSRTIIDALVMKQLTYPDGVKSSDVADVPPEHRDRANELHNALIEDIAENDEGLMELYFEKGELSEEEMRQGLHRAIMRRQLFPIFVTSASEMHGVGRLMSFIDKVLPAPSEMPPAETTSGSVVTADPKADPIALIYRTMAEQHVGDYSFFRLYSGTIRSGMDLENAQTGATERLGQIYTINGRERDPVEQMFAGDIGALVKLKNSHANSTLRPKGSSVVIQPIEYPEPRYRTAIRPSRDGDEDKLAEGLHQLVEEDPSLIISHDQHLKQMVLSGQGEMHLEIARFRLKDRYGVEVDFYKPRVAYRETIQGNSRASYRHKKQTGGAGQFADVSMMVEPINGDFKPPADIKVRGEDTLDTGWGSKIHFVDAIVGGVIDMRRFAGAMQKGVLDAMQDGPVAGYPCGDVRVVVYDGGMHAVDSNEAAFKTAGRACFRDAFRQANPVILEPIYNVEITVPEAYVGDVMGDLNTRRGRIQGIEAEGVFQKIIAQVPEAELYRYSTSLRSMTQGRGIHRGTFAHYEPMPRHVQDKLVEEAAELEDA
jgi:elongation factor G